MSSVPPPALGGRCRHHQPDFPDGDRVLEKGALVQGHPASSTFRAPPADRAPKGPPLPGAAPPPPSLPTLQLQLLLCLSGTSSKGPAAARAELVTHACTHPCSPGASVSVPLPTHTLWDWAQSVREYGWDR